jgi:ABC-type Zn uptake system ZnuABC Zn-binding protein ZnuA
MGLGRGGVGTGPARVVSLLVAVCLGLSLAVGWTAARAQEATPATVGTPTGAGPVLAPLPDAAPPDGSPLVVVASTPLLADLAAQVGGSRVDAHAILPADADPHEYEPVPADLVTVEQAQLIVEFGLNLDRWAVEIVENAGAQAPVVVATSGVPTIASDESGFEGGDPHVWFDPTNVQIMVANIAAALSAADPAGAASYSTRRDAYDQQLADLDTWIAGQVATIPPERRKLVTNHDAFAYYVRRYGLTFVGSVIPSIDTNTEPSAQQTADLIDKIEAEGVPAIFTEASVNPELEEQLAEEAGVKVVDNLYGDNLGQPGTGADTYVGMMVTDTNLIVGALR